MQLLVDRHPQDFLDLREFRAQHGLPESFNIRVFEPKDYTGLGSIDHAGAELHHLRERVLARLPGRLPMLDWLKAVSDLQGFFWGELVAINYAIGLRDPEIDFAAGGFGDVCRAVVYAIIRTHSEHQPPPSFEVIYQEWLNSTIKTASHVHTYSHQGVTWHIQIISHAYGRMGLRIEVDEGQVFVYDHQLACPAEGFMLNLLREVAGHILANSV
jgi:hypothetical protein